jgi:hypothetical protein
MDKETELNTLLTIMKKREELQFENLEELQSITQELVAGYEKTITLHKELESRSDQFIKTKSDHRLSVLTYEADNQIKMIDVFIDILKFLIPTLITIGTVAHIIPQFSGTSIFVFGASAAFLILLAVAIIIRMKKVKSYVSKFKEEHDKFLSEHSDWQRRMAEITGSELERIKKRTEELGKQHELVVERHKTIPPLTLS